MQLTKKLMALSLAVLMTFAVAIPGLAATFSDVADDSPYKEAISTMVSLGLLKGYEDGSFRPNDTITRAEFAAVMTRAIGMEGVASGASSASIFTDMTTNGVDHWATGYVKIAYDKKIILGMGDGTFAPDAPITYEQAVKMIVCTLGREAAANEKGGWPNGYILDANDINLTQNATMSPTNSPAPRALVAQLVFNSLEIKLMERSTGGSMVQTNKTLLNDMLKVTKFTNMLVTVIDGTASVNASAGVVAREGELVLEAGLDVDTYVYKNIMTSDKAKNFLGLYVNGYYKVDSMTEDKILLKMDTISSRNEEITISSDNIESMSRLRLEYWVDRENDAKTKTITISDTAKLVYNGVAEDYLTSNVDGQKNLTYWLDPYSEHFINGKVRLIDSGADGTYDSLFIEDYKTYVIKAPVKTQDSVYDNNYLLQDEYNAVESIQIDPYDRNNTVNIYNAKTGSKMNIESINTYNIVSVAASDDHRTFTCYVSTDTISGTIESKSANGKEYTINKKKYELTKEFASVVKLGKVSMDPSSYGTFYLDKDGKIAAAKVTEAQAGNYMYITSAGYFDTTQSTVDSNAGIEVISLSGSPATPKRYEVADRVNINGDSYTDADDVLARLKKTASTLGSNQKEISGATGATYSQLARVSINSENRVTSITTIEMDGNVPVEGYNNTNTSKSLVLLKNIEAGAEMPYYTSGGGFNGEAFATSTTQVLVVPANRSASEKYTRTTGASYFGAGTRYMVEAYDVNQTTRNAKVIIVYASSSDAEIKNDSHACLVTDASRVKSSTGEGEVYSIELIENGVTKTYETEDTGSVYAALKPGDIIRFSTNLNGQISKIEKEVDAANLKPMATKLGEQEGIYKFKSMFGTVYSYTNNRLILQKSFLDMSTNPPSLTGESDAFETNGTTPVYRVRISGGEATVSDASLGNIVDIGDIKQPNANASKVYAYAVSDSLKMVVIYITD